MSFNKWEVEYEIFDCDVDVKRFHVYSGSDYVDIFWYDLVRICVVGCEFFVYVILHKIDS